MDSKIFSISTVKTQGKWVVSIEVEDDPEPRMAITVSGAISEKDVFQLLDLGGKYEKYQAIYSEYVPLIEVEQALNFEKSKNEEEKWFLSFQAIASKALKSVIWSIADYHLILKERNGGTAQTFQIVRQVKSDINSLIKPPEFEKEHPFSGQMTEDAWDVSRKLYVMCVNSKWKIKPKDKPKWEPSPTEKYIRKIVSPLMTLYGQTQIQRSQRSRSGEAFQRIHPSPFDEIANNVLLTELFSILKNHLDPVPARLGKLLASRKS